MRQAVRKGWDVLSATFDAQDACLVVGVAMLGIGLQQVYPPLGWIVPGAALTALAWPKRAVIMKRQPPQES
jgi:hypothetical protein